MSPSISTNSLGGSSSSRAVLSTEPILTETLVVGMSLTVGMGISDAIEKKPRSIISDRSHFAFFGVILPFRFP